MSKNHSNQINALASKASKAIQIGNLAEAKDCYIKLSRLLPDHPEIYGTLGGLSIQLGKFIDAIQFLNNSLRILPNQPTVLFNQAIAYKQLNFFDKALICYDRAIQLKPDYFEAYFNQANLLKDLKFFDKAIVSYQRAAQFQPNFIGIYLNWGSVLLELKRYDEALTSFDRAMQLKPDDHQPYNSKGNTLQALKHYDEALTSYDRAIQLKPDYHAPHNGKGNTLHELKRYDEALISYDRAMELKPDDYEPHNGKGNTLQELKRYDEALISYDRAIQLKPDYVDGYWNKSLLKLLTGQYEEGWKLYEWRRQAKATKSNYKLYDQPLWLGKESLQNKILLVEAEQGLGDIIQFCRYIPILENIGAKVILETPKALASIIKTIPSNFLILENRQSLPHFDYHIPIMSLPHAFNTNTQNIPASIPYLFSDKIKREYWNKKLSKKTKLRVGLVWSGSTAHRNDKSRSLPLKDLEPVLQLPFEFHSLQKEVRENDQKTLFEFNQVHQHHDELNDFSDTAALIEEMDLIISVDTSVAHLAGALGKDVWILLSYHPDYRWMLDRKDSPWYPTCTLFRQSKIDDWSNVVLEIISNIQNRLT